ncbi:serine hydrolase domain-containing protein [Phytomonospora endophytica]|uniref:CubicO group peptidase (Beta-lactamase class C family) n=1 Tax=Phytomonospora endophytica TaxID=714109 RepID=A0A841FHE3_9ACTN|nr:serine hydrolase domain-containing protein [Phytomonospora endophytica]MBB6036751.1 CubicO group peptidase (beta-lactamase class C family) [Phytomonospora endophytica]GIG68215.1 serine hydrolase [Phytomonospora endophytica]
MTNDNGFSKTGLTKLHDLLARRVASGKIPGLVALVSRGGETHVEVHGTMHHDGGAPTSRDTIFRMASTTKPVAVSATMVLLDECRLRLDDSVVEWLPELADRQVLTDPNGPLDDTVPAARPITVRDLLTSTFGLGIDMTARESPFLGALFEKGVYGQEDGWMLPGCDPDEWMRRLGTMPLRYQPGRRWQYHISDDVLGVLVARVTGRPFEEFLRERILDPLGMKDTGFHVPAGKIDRFGPLYAPNAETGEFHVEDKAVGGHHDRPPVFPSCGGGLDSTADDYHAYFRMLLNGGVHDGERILSKAAVELMTTNRLTPEQLADRVEFGRSLAHLAHGLGQHGGWGFGMAVRTYRNDYAPVGQFGWDGGAGTTAYADPHNGLTGILLTQVGMSSPDSALLINDFWTTLYQAIDD